MKKLLMGIAILLGSASFCTAQTAAKTKPAEKKVAKASPVNASDNTQVRDTKKTAAKAADAKPVVKPTPAATPADSKGVVLKKDGTPDKRYKTSEKVALKKDGTPDKRFKSNKKG